MVNLGSGLVIGWCAATKPLKERMIVMTRVWMLEESREQLLVS